MIKEKEPDVVLLDLIMPKLDGLGVLEKIKKDKELTKVPAFIVISAIAQERVTENAFELLSSFLPFFCGPFFILKQKIIDDSLSESIYFHDRVYITLESEKNQAPKLTIFVIYLNIFT